MESGYSETLVGLALDIGTTTIAAHLCDLHSGAIIATEVAMNPQVGYGEDIMSRMSYVAEEDGGQGTLQTAVLKTIDRLAPRARAPAAHHRLVRRRRQQGCAAGRRTPHQDEHWLIVDVGTNAELVLGNRERLVCILHPLGRPSKVRT